MKFVNTPHRTRYRTVSALVAAGLVLGLGACGDDTDDAGAPVDTPATTTPDTTPDSTTPDTTPDSTTPDAATPDTTTPDTTTPDTTTDFEYPDGADDVVLRIAHEGGFVPVEHAFRNLPVLLVSGDGRVFYEGPQIEIYPGPLLPNVLVRPITDEGVQQLLQLADEHGLLMEREYENPTNIADAPDTVVVVSANGATYEHRAYALGIDEGLGDEADEARQALADFVDAATAWVTADNPELGPEEMLEPETYLVRSIPVDDLDAFEVEPTVMEWPAGLPPLTEATECLALAASDVGPLFADANQLTFFTSGGVTYQLAVTPELPGTGC